MVVADGERNETEREIFDGRARRAATTAVSGLLSPIIQTFERINHFRFFPFSTFMPAVPSAETSFKRFVGGSRFDHRQLMVGQVRRRFRATWLGCGTLDGTGGPERNEIVETNGFRDDTARRLRYITVAGGARPKTGDTRADKCRAFSTRPTALSSFTLPDNTAL